MKQMNNRLTVTINAKKIYRRKVLMRFFTVGLLGLLLILSVIYALVFVTNQTGNFTISLDPNLKAEKGIVISPSSDFKKTPLTLKAEALDYMDNISGEWIPDTVTEVEGSHSTNNYLAYTFFVKNNSNDKTDYQAEIVVKSVISGVDEAVRVAVYYNGEKTVYAKRNKVTGLPEADTIPFVSNRLVMTTKRVGIKPDEVDKYTVVIWLEGNDPECIDDILGGEMKMLMQLVEVD